MTAGHFGFAAAVKSKAPRVPLWALMLATYLLDVVFIFLVSAGIENFSPMNPGQPSYGGVIIHAYYSHSLVGAILISVIAGLAANWLWDKRTGVVICAVVFSHWILDLIVHRPDLPVLPGNLGNLPLLGFGLWNLPVVSALLELALALGGTYLYYQTAKNAPGATGKDGKRNTRALIAAGTTGLFIVLLLLSDFLSLPMIIGVVLMLLIIIFCGWLDSRLNWKAGEIKIELEAELQ
jgi:hypothetical protein